MPYQHILFQVDERGVALLTVNRPDKRNALSKDLVAELREAFESVAGDRAVRALIVGGEERKTCGRLVSASLRLRLRGSRRAR